MRAASVRATTLADASSAVPGRRAPLLIVVIAEAPPWVSRGLRDVSRDADGCGPEPKVPTLVRCKGPRPLTPLRLGEQRDGWPAARGRHPHTKERPRRQPVTGEDARD